MRLLALLTALAVASPGYAQWTKATGTIPDKITTLLVVDTSDSNRIKDLGTSGVEEDVVLGTVTFTNATNRVDFTAHNLVDDDRVYFSGGTMPTGLDAVGLTTGGTSTAVANTYYVINSTTDDFQVSLTQGGSAVTFSDDGSGTRTLYQLLGITLADNSDPVTLTRTDRTSDAWGTGVVIDSGGAFNPHRLVFTDMGSGLPPLQTDAATNGYSYVALVNRFTAAPGDNIEFQPSGFVPTLGYESSVPAFALGDSSSSRQATGTSAAQTATATAIAATGKRHASEAEHRLYFDEPTSDGDGTVTGAFVLEDGPNQVDGIGGTATLLSVASRGQSHWPMELFMFIVADQDILSSTELNTILEDPLGTLVDTGAAASGLLLRRRRN